MPVVVGRRVVPGATGLLVVLGLLVHLLVSDQAYPAFTAATQRPGNAIVSDTLDPPSSFAASRPCYAPAPTFRSKADATALATSITVSRPADVVAGDALLAFVQHHDSSSVPQPPDGWTVLRRNTSTPSQSLLAGKLATASEPAGYTFTGLDGSDATAATIVAYQGVDATTPFEATGVQTGGGTVVTAPSVFATTAATRWVTGFLVDHYVGTITAPSGTTVRTTVQAAGPQESKLLVSDRVVTVTNSTGSASATLTSGETASGFSVLLRSSAPAGTVTLTWVAAPDTYAGGYALTRTGSAATTTLTPRTTTTALVTDLAAASAATFSLRSTAGTWRSTAVTAAVPAC